MSIGYKVSDDYVQQVSPKLYVIRIANTYYLEDRGSISCNYVFQSNKKSYFYPVNEPAVSTITSGTGEFYTPQTDFSFFVSSLNYFENNLNIGSCL